MQIEVAATYRIQHTKAAMRFDAVLGIGTDDPQPCEGGHGEVRTYLAVSSEDSCDTFCLVCVGTDMLEGRLLGITTRDGRDLTPLSARQIFVPSDDVQPQALR